MQRLSWLSGHGIVFTTRTNAEDGAAYGPWQDVAIDLMEPMPGGENLLVVVDYYSRFFDAVVRK